MRYLENRGIIPQTPRHVWAFLGDGEMDEPESMGSITLASREKLDNLIFVINCNLQRLDGPVRGNGKVIQELEARLPRRRLERDQGHLGQRLGCAAGARHHRPAAKAHGRSGGRRVSDLRHQGRRLHPPAILRQVSGTARPGLAPERRGSLSSCAAAATIRKKVYNAYKQALETKGKPTADSGAHRQGLRPGRSRRRPQHHPPAEEAQRERDRALPLALRNSDSRRSGAQRLVLPSAVGQPGDELPARAAPAAGRLHAQPQRAAEQHRRRRRSNT